MINEIIILALGIFFGYLLITIAQLLIVLIKRLVYKLSGYKVKRVFNHENKQFLTFVKEDRKKK